MQGFGYLEDMPSDSGVLVVNLGTPDAPTPEAVRRFLSEFLSDPRVVNLPRLPCRSCCARSSCRFGQKRALVPTAKSGPPRARPATGTEALTRALAQRLATMPGEPTAVAMGMTYGNPSIDHALQKLQSAGIRRLVVLPLYPQYSATTTAAALDRVDAALARWRAPPERVLIEDYHAEPDHVAALAASISAARAPFEHLLFSFHGIPRRYAAAGDPYGGQCQATARLVAARLALPAERWSVAFQSRVGRARWLEPYTEDRLRELARAGTGRLAVTCPGFAVDRLETLEEIAIRGAATFIAAGGVDFEYIPALNDSAAQVECLMRLVKERLP